MGEVSVSNSRHFIARRIGSIRSTISPLRKIRTVPLDSLTTTETALVLRVIAAADQCLAPKPVVSVISTGAVSIIRHEPSTTPSEAITNAPSS